MPVHGINDYTVPEEAEDYRHLKAIKHDFDGFLLKEAFVMSAQKQRITAIISIITIVLMTIIGFVLPIIYLSNNKVISNGDDIHTLCDVLAVMCMIGTFLAVTFLIVRFPIFWVCNQFKRGYSAYLEGYLAVLTVMEDYNWGHNWGMNSSPTDVNCFTDISIVTDLENCVVFTKYDNDPALKEAWTYGMYHALKFFLPSRPEDIVAVLRDALTTDDAHRDEDIFGWKMNCVDSLIKVHQMFMTKNRIYAKRYKFYRSIYPNGCDGNGPNTNADEIKIYVDSDGEIYRYKTEDELNRIKQKGISLKKEK